MTRFAGKTGVVDAANHQVVSNALPRIAFNAAMAVGAAWILLPLTPAVHTSVVGRVMGDKLGYAFWALMAIVCLVRCAFLVAPTRYSGHVDAWCALILTALWLTAAACSVYAGNSGAAVLYGALTCQSFATLMVVRATERWW